MAIVIGNEADMLYFPYNSEIGDDGVGDRLYDADDWRDNFALFIGNGVFPNPVNQLRVEAISGMVLQLRQGNGWLEGGSYVQRSNFEFSLEPAHLTLGRRDVVVLRHDAIARMTLPVYIPGTPAATPQIPPLVRTDDVFDLRLCEITVNPNAQAITQANILDTRPNSAVCGYVTGLVHNVDTKDLFLQYETYLNEQIAMWEERKAQQSGEWQSQMTKQHEAFQARYLAIRDLISMFETQTFDIINHDFDAAWNKRGCILQRDADNFFRETWTVTATDMLLAERITTFDDGLMQIHTKFYPWEVVEGNTTVKTLAWEQTRNLIDWSTFTWEVA